MLFLRELSESDLSRVSTWRQDRTLAKGFGNGFRFTNPETDHQWFQNYMTHRDCNIRLAICLTDSDAHIGNVYILNIDWVSRSGEFHILIGDPQARRKGFGVEATRQALRHAFDDRNLNRISLTVLSDNQAALALYDKCGFRREGTLRQAVFKDGTYHDLIVMGLLRNESELG